MKPSIAESAFTDSASSMPLRFTLHIIGIRLICINALDWCFTAVGMTEGLQADELLLGISELC